MWNRLIKDEKGFTGLEAAIVLVAFVVVAAVFSYVMLGAGFYTTQKSQEVVHTGVAQASSSLSPSGDVIVEGVADGEVGNITFYIANTAGGSSVDLNKTILTYVDIDDFVTQEEGQGKNGWVYTPIISATNGARNLVEKGEKYKVEVNLTTFKANSLPRVNEQFRIDVKPPEGAVLIIQKSMPAAITSGTYYAVY
ncbi:flagellin [Methanosarcina sp. 2.H.T.1A.6]|uniref:archaellin/type IV pilin N-terminal domain-containing protein n=1 Tax=unclassified Methanosarcina TaxID=2644672 RepID=UPI0006222CA9|nr:MULTISPECIES: archaellin/type IV pilin N-terminal domain-containing protein [unclassified Methanosarcina]KKG15615.1 flagellin [Methanosarcina sp. 2.H.T.1A.3]KKG19523.1 flagellin [Methanosarcina sp. 2.H.T.1A.6]KKG27516.1 flagellin [Methanosarcina sp. 2.H.T.1A.8]KKG28449.1 flagellin [Methanosarcina sp. 2.H.T.1A.15]